MNDLGWLVVATLLGGAVVTLPALVRQRLRDPMRLTLFTSMLVLGLGNLVSRPPVLASVDEATAPGTAKVVLNVLILSGLCLMVAFLREHPIVRPRDLLRWEVVTGAAALLAMLLVTAALPPSLRDHQLDPASLADQRVRWFYYAGNAYLLTGYAACAVLAWRHAGRGSPTVRVALVTIAVGLAGLATSCVARVICVVGAALEDPGAPVDQRDVLAFSLVATVVVCVGMTLPGLGNALAVLGEIRGHRRRYRGLDELWRRLVGAHPDLVLDGLSYRGLGLPTGYALATYRRYVECRDGLVRLGALATVAVGAHATPAEAAEAVDRALRADRQEGAGPAEPVPWAVHDRYEDDVEALGRVSSALRDLRVQERSAVTGVGAGGS